MELQLLKCEDCQNSMITGKIDTFPIQICLNCTSITFNCDDINLTKLEFVDLNGMLTPKGRDHFEAILSKFGLVNGTPIYNDTDREVEIN